VFVTWRRKLLLGCWRQAHTRYLPLKNAPAGDLRLNAGLAATGDRLDIAPLLPRCYPRTREPPLVLRDAQWRRAYLALWLTFHCYLLYQACATLLLRRSAGENRAKIRAVYRMTRSITATSPHRRLQHTSAFQRLVDAARRWRIT